MGFTGFYRVLLGFKRGQSSGRKVGLIVNQGRLVKPSYAPECAAGWPVPPQVKFALKLGNRVTEFYRVSWPK